MNEQRHETKNALWRKKVKKISVLALGSEILWRPQHGRSFTLLQAFVKVRNHAGTNSDDPEIVIDNGTDAQNFVAAVDLASQVEGAIQRLTVTGNFEFNYDNPLRMKITDAPAGSTTYDVDVILVALETSEIQS